MIPKLVTHIEEFYGNIVYWRIGLYKAKSPYYDYNIYRWYYYENGKWVCSDGYTCPRRFKKITAGAEDESGLPVMEMSY